MTDRSMVSEIRLHASHSHTVVSRDNWSEYVHTLISALGITETQDKQQLMALTIENGLCWTHQYASGTLVEPQCCATLTIVAYNDKYRMAYIKHSADNT